MTQDWSNYPPGSPPPPGLQQRKTNGLAIASIVVSGLSITAFCGLTSIVGAILGHVALGQIKERNEEGASLARAGIIVGWIGVGLLIVGGALFALLIVADSSTT